jgi:ppGpp synthetase/RelA/SpoT-type nucleotidyltranferase
MAGPLLRSPLEKVVQDPKLTQILEAMRNSLHRNEEFQIRKEDVCHVREVFCAAIEAGERGLYDFTQDLADGMLGCRVSLFSEVWGRCIHKEHGGIQKSQTKIAGSYRDLNEEADSDRSFLHAPVCWCGKKTLSVASFVKGVVEKENPFGVQLISTRIKTPSNLAYKVADILFDIDKMFRRDKVLNYYSQIVKDVYGMKIVTEDLKSLERVIRWFKELPPQELLEAKDYLGPRRKKSGFEAYKIAIQRNHQVFEVQLQTEAMLERETLGFRENHLTYKERQMRLRAQLGKRYEEVYKALEILLCSDGTTCRGLRLNNKGIDEEPEENSAGEQLNKYASCQPNAGQKKSLNEEVKFA